MNRCGLRIEGAGRLALCQGALRRRRTRGCRESLSNGADQIPDPLRIGCPDALQALVQQVHQGVVLQLGGGGLLELAGDLVERLFRSGRRSHPSRPRQPG